MKWYSIFGGTDFSDHSVGSFAADFDGDSVSVSSMVDHAKDVAGNKAWLVLSLTDIHPETHELQITKVWEHWAPLKKKIVLDPTKGKIKKPKSASEVINQAIPQLFTWIDPPQGATLGSSGLTPHHPEEL